MLQISFFYTVKVIPNKVKYKNFVFFRGCHLEQAEVTSLKDCGEVSSNAPLYAGCRVAVVFMFSVRLHLGLQTSL